MTDNSFKTDKAYNLLNKEYEKIIYELAKGEGSTLSYANTIGTIYNKEVEGLPKDIILVRNLTKGLNFILHLLNENIMEFEKPIFCHINRIVASDTNYDNLGDFRKGNIKIVGSKNEGVTSFLLDEKFKDLINEFKETPKTNDYLLNTFLKLCKYQFFGDGNKRTSQLFINGLLVKYGYTHFVLNFKDTKNIKALIEYYDNDNSKPLIDIIKEKQIELLKDNNLYKDKTQNMSR